ncbi:hypothetical protein BHQ29_09200 [Pseudomonas sp. LPH1]|nr:hypothetical protein [Pseudomonas sp. LPH1]AQZ33447.1 hypothetical protein BHQ29_09200 [Pseudomonas sp. LPH1]
MEKSTYLQTPAVANFVKWMSENLDGDTFAHQYTNRRSGCSWRCDSLYDAYAQYHWPHPGNQRLGEPTGTTFESSAATLQALSQDLQSALGSQGSDHSVVTAAVDVMTWGGVRAGNVRWLHANQANLPQVLSSTRQALDAGSTDHPLLVAKDLRFNAGMTKVYSLICDRFVIYDSRVAAALGWAVVKFCQAAGLSEVPQELRFPWAPAKSAANDSSPKRRNPGQSEFFFPRLKSGANHAAWNLKASWLLSDVLEQPAAQNSRFNQIECFDTRLRALEAALFMIGYDLDATQTGASAAISEQVMDSAQEDEADSFWNDCQTLSKGNPFRYKLTDSGIAIEGGPTFTLADISSTLMQLWTDFGSSAFPLANSATDVRNGTAPKGMGVAYFQATGANPPDTSKLAAVLEELGAIVPTAGYSARSLSWTLDLRRLGLDQGAGTIDIDSFWAEVLRAEQEG